MINLQINDQKYKEIVTKKCQNESGLKMEEFLIEHNLYAANTPFKKKSRPKTAWIGHVNGKTVYNVSGCINVVFNRHTYIF